MLWAPAGVLRPGFCLLLALTLLTGAGPVWAKVAARPPKQPVDPVGGIGLGIFFGGASYQNDDFNDDLEAIGYERIESGLEYGLVFDYRASKLISVGAELSHIGADSPPPGGTGSGPTATYGVSAAPIVVNLTIHPLRKGIFELQAFGGAGPLLGTTVRAVSGGFEIEGSKTGLYAHAGLQAEARFSELLSVTFRGFVRHAATDGVDLRTSTGDPDAIWDVDFNGAGWSFGPRIYFGRSQPD